MRENRRTANQIAGREGIVGVCGVGVDGLGRAVDRGHGLPVLIEPAVTSGIDTFFGRYIHQVCTVAVANMYADITCTLMLVRRAELLLDERVAHAAEHA